MLKELNVKVGYRIREHREFLGMNREKFAEKVELSPQFVADVENGKKGLSIESLYKICDNCEISADYLVFGNKRKYEGTSPLDNMLKEIPVEYYSKFADLIRMMNGIVIENSKKGNENG